MAIGKTAIKIVSFFLKLTKKDAEFSKVIIEFSRQNQSNCRFENDWNFFVWDELPSFQTLYLTERKYLESVFMIPVLLLAHFLSDFVFLF